MNFFAKDDSIDFNKIFKDNSCVKNMNYIAPKTDKNNLFIAYFLILTVIGITLSCATKQKYIQVEDNFSIANNEFKNKNYPRAVKYFKKYINEDLNDTSKAEYAQYKIAEAYNSSGDYRNAIKEYKKLVRNYPATSFSESAYFQTGYLYFKLRDYSEAAEQFAIAKEKYFGNLKLTYYFAESLFLGGRGSEAVKYYSQLLSSKNDYYPYAAFKLIKIFWLEKKDRKAAYTYIDKIIKDYPSFEHMNEVLKLKKDLMWSYITKKNGLSDNSISTICFDGDDLWIGLWLGSVMRFTRSTGQYKNYRWKDGLVSENIRDIKVQDNDVWIATYDGVARFNKANNKWTSFNSIKEIANQKVKVILLDDNYIWFGTLGNGAIRYNTADDTWKAYEKENGLAGNYIVDIAKDEDSIWFCNINGGISRCNRKTGKIKNYESPIIKSIAIDDEDVWFGLWKAGLLCFNRTTDKWKKIQVPASEEVYINTIASKRNELWVGTLGSGVFIFNKISGKWKNLKTSDGLNSNDITTIEFEGDYVWIGTLENGISILYYGGGADSI